MINNLRPGNIVFDMDEVLFNISPFMYKKIRLNWNEYFPYLKDFGPLTDKEILNRPYFALTDWLIKDELKLDPDISKVMHQVLYKTIKDMCFDEKLYDTLKPTKIAVNTLMNKNFLDNPAIKSCTIISRYPESHPEMKDAKEKIIKKYFSHSKIKYHLIPSTKSKSEKLKELGIDWSLIIDDEIRNIRDFAENFDLNRREFLIPRLGYNNMLSDLKLLIEGKGGTVNYYDYD